jgi:hypothetical protein
MSSVVLARGAVPERRSRIALYDIVLLYVIGRIGA